MNNTLYKGLLIGGIEYEVIRDKQSDDGEVVWNDKLLKIKQDLNKEMTDSTIAHEILHVLFYMSGAVGLFRNKGLDEEVLVHMLENMVYLFLRDNTNFYDN